MPNLLDMNKQAVGDYIASKPAQFAAALAELRARLCLMLPEYVECMSYGMPGLRAPQPRGKMVIGYAAFAKHLGVYPHSGRIMAHIDAAPFKTSKSGFVFPPDQPPPDPLLRALITARLAEIAAKDAGR